MVRGQRLAPALRQEVDRLRKSVEVRCSDAIGEKLKRISPKTIDRLLAGERQSRQLRKNRNPAVHPLLYQKIPVKVASEWDTRGRFVVHTDFPYLTGGRYRI